jgi:Retrotransposon gag protein/Zinc knuckle
VLINQEDTDPDPNSAIFWSVKTARPLLGKVWSTLIMMTTPVLPTVEELTSVISKMQQEINQLKQSHATAVPTSVPQSSGLKVKPPKPGSYSGGRDAANWLFTVERFFDAVQLTTDVERLTYVGTILTGAAQSWWRYLYQRASEGHADEIPQSWQQFRTALLGRFSRTSEEEFARARMKGFKQKKSVRAYNMVFNELALQAASMDELTKVGLYLDGLKEVVRRWVRRLRPQTLVTAMQLAEEFETGEIQDAATRGRKFEREQPTPMDVDALTAALQQLQGKQATTAQQQQGDKQNERPRFVRKCYACGKPGHIARECKNPRPDWRAYRQNHGRPGKGKPRVAAAVGSATASSGEPSSDSGSDQEN